MRANIETINISKKERDFLKEHLNIWWLRPESALWDAIASATISQSKINAPSLDLGCGNGLFSFITSGGCFAPSYDWFRNVDVEGFWENKDIFDTDCGIEISEHIIKKPNFKFTYGLDHKNNLLVQAEKLNFYNHLITHDANNPLPFPDGSMKTVFSNILYWLKDPIMTLGEVSRILEDGGRALVCLPNSNFYDFCESYRWKEKKSELLRIINRGRSDNILWVANKDEFSLQAKNVGLTVVHHKYYLSKQTLEIWDTGLRPFSPYLIYMANRLPNKEREQVKIKWVEDINKLLLELYKSDKMLREERGFQFFELEKNDTN